MRRRVFDSAWFDAAILRGAALLVPNRQRAEWLAEWTAELWYIRRSVSRESSAGAMGATAFCLGAFQDAFWLRCNSPSANVWRKAGLESPVWCILFLAVLAAGSLFFAFQLPGARDTILPSPYQHARDLAMISAIGHFAAQIPTVPVAEYQSLRNRAKHLFTDLAFYRPVRARLRTAQTHTEELTVALASGNLFELLDLPFALPAAGPGLILSDTTWRQSFDSDPDIAGRVVEVAGQKAVMRGVIPMASWPLPGRVDAWLLVDEQRLAALPAEAKGFVLAHLNTSPGHAERNLRSRISVPNAEGGYDRLECTSLARGHLMFAHVLMIVFALLILPATTSMSLGEYPGNRHSPRLATRLRRWIFLTIKVALLIVIVFFGILDLAAISSTPIQPHGFLVAYILAFRWALSDQRKRCPVCLRLLTNPIRIGWSSRTFLEWHGTELMCTKGHGLLYVPEIPTSCYSTQRWLYLDCSWRGLISRPKAEAIERI
ncbi:MAG: hypothetical protein ACRD7E_11990 [Bryobacteraceae bacterium]